jgi:hypothetical protein
LNSSIWGDTSFDIQIVGIAHGAGDGLQRFIRCEDESCQLVTAASYPSHGWIRWPDREDDPHIQAGFSD